MLRVLAFDPGVCPAACLIVQGEHGITVVETWDGDDTSIQYITGRKTKRRAPSSPLLRAIVVKAQPDFVVVERVAARPEQGVSSTFNFGYAAGLIEGVCVGLGLELVRVLPQQWKAELLFPSKAPKGYSRHIACMVAPRFAHLWEKVKDHNTADAFCMAYWGRDQKRGSHGA